MDKYAWINMHTYIYHIDSHIITQSEKGSWRSPSTLRFASASADMRFASSSACMREYKLQAFSSYILGLLSLPLLTHAHVHC
jgi:hypothetical protein